MPTRNLLAGALVAIAIAGIPNAAAASEVVDAACANADVVPAADTVAAAVAATRCLVNAERGERGLRPLRRQANLDRSARAYAAAMVSQHFFAHVTPDGGRLLDRARAARYISPNLHFSVGEALGWGANGLATPRAMVGMWMDSPGHRAIILGAWRDAGIGVVVGSPREIDPATPAATYVLHGGRRRARR